MKKPLKYWRNTNDQRQLATIRHLNGAMFIYGLHDDNEREQSMRPIEFRGWWRDREGNAHELIEDISERPISDLNEAYFIIEQYTGLLDKNGTKIFEGDILQHFEFNMDGVPIGQEVNAVEFVPAMFICGKFHLREFQIKKYEFEVIGNIHENKGLLK